MTQDPQSAEINTDENAGDGPSSEGVQISEGEQIPEGEQSIEQTEENSKLSNQGDPVENQSTQRNTKTGDVM